MKTRAYKCPHLPALLALTAASLFILPPNTVAQEKGSQRLMKLSRTESAAPAAATALAGDTIAMSCPKCKDTWVTVVEQTFKAASPPKTHQVKQHQCPGCGTERVTTGHGKARTTTLIHTCSNCESEDVNCCVTKKGSGPTMGMN